MRTRMIGPTALAAFLLAGTAAFSMGGGGGGGYGGGFGPMGGQATFDDYAIAVRLIHHAEYADAIPHLESALAQRPHDADILNYLGYTHRMVGDYSGSLDYYKRALAIDPDHKGVHEYLGELYLQLHDQPSAQKELDDAREPLPRRLRRTRHADESARVLRTAGRADSGSRACGDAGNCSCARDTGYDAVTPLGRSSSRGCARQTRSGVAGMSICTTPIASAIALITAGNAPTVPASPQPLAPRSFVLQAISS